MHKKTEKTIFITVFHSFVSKNILNTDAFIALRDSGMYRFVLLVPRIKKSFFEEHYGHSQVCIEGIDMHIFAETRVEKRMHFFARLLINTHYLHYKRRELYEARPTKVQYIKYLFTEMFVRMFADSIWTRSFFRALDARVSTQKVFEVLIARYNPVLIFSTDLFEQMGYQLFREAKKHSIQTLGMVRSWDNCLSKGLLRAIPDHVMVNNDVIRDELITLHGVSADIIEVVGLPQFDRFITQKPIAREALFESLGLDPQKKLVLFAPGGTVLSDTDGDICRMLIEANDAGMFGERVQFFVRNHPQHPADLSSVPSRPDMYIETPGQILDTRTHKETELTPADQDFLRNILAHTDVLVWVATSLCLDALVYDVPQVVINFDGYQTKDYYHSVRRYHDEDHMKKMFVHHPFQVATSKETLVAAIRAYVTDPLGDREGREIVRKQQLATLDGYAGERIMHTISRMSS